MSNRIRTITPGTYGAPWSRKCTKTKHHSGRYSGRHDRRHARLREMIAVVIDTNTDRLLREIDRTGRAA